jgi:hypothetical protein
MNWIWWRAAQYGKPESAAQMADIHLELCDILHFGISMDIVNAARGDFDREERNNIDHRCGLYRQFFYETRQTPTEFYSDIEQVVITAIRSRTFDIEHFARACNAVGLTLPTLLTLYFAKSTLNHFRQDNGYNLPKDNPLKYVKLWPHPTQPGEVVEDNFHLSSIVRPLIAKNTEEDLLEGLRTGEIQKVIYTRLGVRYPGVVVSTNPGPSFRG